MSNSKKILVVGGNAAGPSAAAKAKRIDPEAEVILFEAGDFISTGTCELPYVLSGEVKSYEDVVFFDPESFYNKKGVKVFLHHLVEQIDRKNKRITVKNLADGTLNNYDYDKLVLTTGAKANSLPALGKNLQNVFQLKSVSDLIEVKKYIKNIEGEKSVLIIGSGYIGLETAEAFKSLGFEVTVAEKAGVPMPNAEPEISHLILDTLKKHSIKTFFSVDLKFNLSENKVVSANIEGRVKNFDLIIQSVGFKPNADLAAGANLKLGESGALIVDNKMKTSDPNIFAAGDNCEIKDKVTNTNTYLPLATLAHEQGHIAGANAAGGNLYSEPVVKNIAVKIFDNVLVSIGITEAEAKKKGLRFQSISSVTNNLVPVMPNSRKVFGKLLFEESSKNILGASFYGGQEVIGYGDMISAFIYNKIPGDVLSKIDYNYTPPYSPFVNLLSILGRKIK